MSTKWFWCFGGGLFFVGLAWWILFGTRQGLAFKNTLALAQSDGWLGVVGGELVNLGSGEKFSVRSTQYIRVVQQSCGSAINTFAPGYYSQSETERAFSQMQSLGYNSVRLVFHNQLDALAGDPDGLCREGASYSFTNCVNEQSLLNLAQTINLAQKHQLKVILSFIGGTPFTYYTNVDPRYQGENINYLSEQTVRDLGRYYFDFFNYLREKTNLVTLLAVEPMAEPALDTASFPFNSPGLVLKYPHFYVPQGKEYSIGETLLAKTNGQSSLEMKEILNFVLINSFNHWRKRIQEVEPHLLVLYDQFPAYAVQKKGTASTAPTTPQSAADSSGCSGGSLARQVNDLTLTSPFLQADLVGLQLYPDYLAQGNPDGNLADLINFTAGFATQLAQLEKPFLVMEFGLRRDSSQAPNASQTLISWQVDSCRYQPAGWNFFNWDADNFAYLTAKEDNFALAKALSPKYRPNPCHRVGPGWHSIIGDPGMQNPNLRILLTTDGSNEQNFAQGNPAPRYADCINLTAAGDGPEGNLITQEDNDLKPPDSIPPPHQYDPNEDPDYTPNKYTDQKELHLADKCRTVNARGQVWYHWSANAWTSTNQAPRVEHRWSQPADDGFDGWFRGVWDGSFNQPGSGLFALNWSRGNVGDGVKRTLWQVRARSSVQNPWVMAFVPTASIWRQINPNQPPRTPNFLWQAWIKVTHEEYPGQGAYRFAFPELSGCWSVTGKPCNEVDYQDWVTRFFALDLNPLFSRKDSCRPDHLANCPPYHLLADGKTKVRKGAPNCAPGQVSDGHCYPYDAYYYWCRPDNAPGPAEEKCDPFFPHQEILQLSPHPEWQEYGIPSRPPTTSEWVGYEGWFSFNLGALTNRVYWEGRPEEISWESVYIGPEILNSPDIDVSWQTTGWNVLVPLKQGKNCLGARDLNCDGVVNFADLLSWRRVVAQKGSGADLNHDGRIDLLDYLSVLQGLLGG